MNTMVQVTVKCFMTITQLNEYNGASDSLVFHDYYTAEWIQWCKWQLSVSWLLPRWMNTMVQVTVKCFMTITQLNEYNGASDS